LIYVIWWNVWVFFSLYNTLVFDTAFSIICQYILFTTSMRSGYSILGCLVRWQTATESENMSSLSSKSANGDSRSGCATLNGLRRAGGAFAVCSPGNITFVSNENIVLSIPE
jgi:hypothetical protein